MNARTSVTPAKLHLASEPPHNPYAHYYQDMHDLFSHAMDRALGVQKSSLAAVVKMQSDVIEMQMHVCDAEPTLGAYGNLLSESIATCMEIQMTWLNLLVACAKQGTEAWLQIAGMGITLASGTTPTQPQMQQRERVAVMAAAA